MPDNRHTDEGGIPVPEGLTDLLSELEEVESAQSNGAQLRPLREILNDLRQPLPPRLIKTRNQGGTNVSYIEWQTAVRYLDAYAPGWEGKVTDVKQVTFAVTDRNRSGQQTAQSTARRVDAIEVTYAITIRTSDFPRGITRESTGFEIITSDRMYGNPVANAEAQAKKRAAAQFGLGLYLYDGDEGTPVAATTSSSRHALDF